MKKVRRVRTDLASANIPAFIADARTIKTKLEGDTAFDGLDSKIALLGNAITILESANNAFNLAEQAVEQKASELADAKAALEVILSILGAGVENVAEGETTIVLRSGFDLQAERLPVGELTAPQQLVAKMSDLEGGLDLRWRTVHGARSYIVEVQLDGSTEWVQSGITTRVSFKLAGLQSGKKYRVRVRALGASGLGPWSDEAVKMAA